MVCDAVSFFFQLLWYNDSVVDNVDIPLFFLIVQYTHDKFRKNISRLCMFVKTPSFHCNNTSTLSFYNNSKKKFINYKYKMTLYGWIGGTLSVVYNIPQIVHVYRTKEIKGISNTSIALRIISYGLVIYHTYSLNDIALFSTTCIGLVQLLIIYIQLCMYKEDKVILEVDV